MKVLIAIDNNIPPGNREPFRAEHGLSMLIEIDNRKILFDSGQTGSVVHNLSLLGIHPSQLDTVVLSHGHYDHTGGLLTVLQHARKRMSVYCHPAVFSERYSVAGNVRCSIGLPFSRRQLEAYGAEFQTAECPVELAPGLWTSGAIARETAFERGDTKLVRSAGATGQPCTCEEQDSMPDDLALFARTSTGLTVLSGCAHSGIVNIIRQGLAVTGCHRLQAIIGGTHLGPVSKEQQQETMKCLAEFEPDLVAANHCTGFMMMARLLNAFGERFLPAFTGTEIKIN